MSKITIFSKNFPKFHKNFFFPKVIKNIKLTENIEKKNYRSIPDLTLGSKWVIWDQNEKFIFKPQERVNIMTFFSFQCA